MKLELSKTQCYQALRARDARFDGKFFTCVKTTGIYCRPICPARAAKLENLFFCQTAFEAEAAGFRPCLRCRPEAAPNSAAWQGTQATVRRAMRLIEDGALVGCSVEDLAARLGVGSRHLSRLFQQHVGVSPIQVFQTCRLQLAKQLLFETSLPMHELAFAAGFDSVRRFNVAFRKHYGLSPTKLREKRKVEEKDIVILLAYRGSYDWNAMLQYLGPRLTERVEAIKHNRYVRNVQFGSTTGLISVGHKEESRQLELRISPNLNRHVFPIVTRVKRLFDLSADPDSITKLLRKDPELKPHFSTRGDLRLPGAWDGFEVAVRAIVGQQISVAAATTIMGRIASKYGQKTQEDNDLSRTFPTPERLARARYSGLGLTRSRFDTLKRLCQEITSGHILLDGSMEWKTLEERLFAVKGIGPWTVQYLQLKGFNDPDAFPAKDLGLLKAFGLQKASNGFRVLEQKAERWRPWRAYAAIGLWKSLN